MSATIIPYITHPVVRTTRAAEAARMVASRYQLDAGDADFLARKARALVKSGCSPAWAVSMIRRAARGLRKTPRSQA